MKPSVLVFILVNMCYSCRSELPVFSSELPVSFFTKIANAVYDFEFLLKERSNLTDEIRPSRTVPLAAGFSSETDTPTTINDSRKSNSFSVPLIASLHLYDEGVVRVFNALLGDSARLQKLSSTHQSLVKRYVEEWEEIISDPWPKGHPQAYLSDLESLAIILPKEIGQSYKLLRIANRVKVELPVILSFSTDPEWKSVAEEVLSVQMQCGEFFSPLVSSGHSDSMFKLGFTYYENPSQLYPSHILPKTPVKDFISVALSEEAFKTPTEALKWIDLAVESIINQTGPSLTDVEANKKVSDLLLEQNRTQSQSDLGRDDSFSKQEFLLRYAHVIKNVYLSLNAINLESERKTTSIEENKQNVKIITYEDLCKGTDIRTAKQLAKLHCRLDRQKSPWLFLMPAKVEVISEDPEILFFHHVISNVTISKIQQIALPMLKHAKFQKQKKFHVFNPKIRFSYSTFLNGNISQELQYINRLSGHLTGLNTVDEDAAEKLQVNVYPAGGVYVMHMDTFGATNLTVKRFDFAKKTRETTVYQSGDRLATLMYYLSEVEGGGRTVFPYLGFSINPEKGGAVLWYSLLPSGEEDKRLKHGGCPLKSGVKWVANKWIRFNSQVFKKPCVLEERWTSGY